MAQVRGQTYADYAWPPALGQLYQRNGLTLALAPLAPLQPDHVMLSMAARDALILSTL